MYLGEGECQAVMGEILKGMSSTLIPPVFSPFTFPETLHIKATAHISNFCFSVPKENNFVDIFTKKPD